MDLFSSWKYEGWLGSIYSPGRYRTRGKFSKKKFEAEYAESFPTVCGDFAFYQFPSAAYWRGLFEGTPPSLSFGLKVSNLGRSWRSKGEVHGWSRAADQGPR